MRRGLYKPRRFTEERNMYIDLLKKTWTVMISEPFSQADDQWLSGSEDKRRHVLPICLITLIVLTVIEYFGFFATFEKLKWFRFSLEYWNLSYWAFWSLVRFIAYVPLTILLCRLILKTPLRELGVEIRGKGTNWTLYLGLYLFLLPFVFAASFLPSFVDTYPFYDEAAKSWRHFLYWEFFYGLQFLSLEFFFRGFMIHTLKKAVGSLAVPIMMIPYCMIHFQKPLPECLGSIVAGLVLGALSLKTGRIWGGVALHIGVAATMDVLALWQRGVF